MLRDSCVVGVKVYGRRPNILREIKNNINEANRTAHLCPGKLTGINSSRVSRPMNQFCSVNNRLLSHRVVGVGNRSQGKVKARAIKGMPKYTGLINWSKKLSVMVSFKVPL